MTGWNGGLSGAPLPGLRDTLVLDVLNLWTIDRLLMTMDLVPGLPAM